MGHIVSNNLEMRVPVPLQTFIDFVLIEAFGGILPFGNQASCMNIKFSAHYFFEIDPDAIMVSATHFPQAINLGDISEWSEQRSLEILNLYPTSWFFIDGGPPCVSVSQLKR